VVWLLCLDAADVASQQVQDLEALLMPGWSAVVPTEVEDEFTARLMVNLMCSPCA